MLDLALIEETLDELLTEAPTTFKTCERIAHLSITRDLILQRMNRGVNGEQRTRM